MSIWTKTLQELRRYPSAIVGLCIIGMLMLLAVYAVVSLPYHEAVRLWMGGEAAWEENPRLARPWWVNAFTRAKLPPTLVFSSDDRPDSKVRQELDHGEADILITLTFDYQYDAFPRELAVFLTGSFQEVRPYAALEWHTPDGRTFQLAGSSVRSREVHRISQSTGLRAELGGLAPEVGLFADPQSDPPVPLKGRYRLVVEGMLFEPGSDIDARLVLYGQVHGLAGTDHLRRDLTVALLWGTPVALIFGLVAAFATTLGTMVMAATSAWYGHWVDGLLERVNELEMILPNLPILVMVGTLYSRSIWVILGLVILLGIFGGGFKVYRAMFLQAKEQPYLEAARAYGAGDWRIIFAYLIPRVLPVLVPQLVVVIPGFVFLEATLSVLGLGDPVMPTWGKVLDDAFRQGALYMGHYHWVLAPLALLMLTGLGFSMVGFALDRIMNPRLREQ